MIGGHAGAWHDAPMRVPGWSSSLLLSLAALAAQGPPDGAPEVAGRIEQHAGLRLLRVWGQPYARGYAHGRLLAGDIAAALCTEFDARFARRPALLRQARAALPRVIEYPADVQQELDGLWQGIVDAGVDRHLPELDRAFDREDLLLANALDVFGLMGCSSFTVWGEQAEGGGVLTARNFDWPFTGEHLLAHTLLLVSHLPDGRAVATVGWPGYVGCVTGVSSHGTAAFLHVGSARIDYTPEPSSWPSAVAARRMLELDGENAAAICERARALLEYTSPPVGFLTHLVLPTVPPAGVPVAVFETDSGTSVAGAVDHPFVLTNHFRTRTDGRPASRDSLDREQRLRSGVAGCIDVDDRQVSVDEAWRLLTSVQRGGGHAFGTLHSLVFRFAPWHFELRVATLGPDGVVAAPVSARRHALTRAQLFADGEAIGGQRR